MDLAVGHLRLKSWLLRLLPFLPWRENMSRLLSHPALWEQYT